MHPAQFDAELTHRGKSFAHVHFDFDLDTDEEDLVQEIINYKRVLLGSCELGKEGGLEPQNYRGIYGPTC